MTSHSSHTRMVIVFYSMLAAGKVIWNAMWFEWEPDSHCQSRKNYFNTMAREAKQLSLSLYARWNNSHKLLFLQPQEQTNMERCDKKHKKILTFGLAGPCHSLLSKHSRNDSVRSNYLHSQQPHFLSSSSIVPIDLELLDQWNSVVWKLFGWVPAKKNSISRFAVHFDKNETTYGIRWQYLLLGPCLLHVLQLTFCNFRLNQINFVENISNFSRYRVIVVMICPISHFGVLLKRMKKIVVHLHANKRLKNAQRLTFT